MLTDPLVPQFILQKPQGRAFLGHHYQARSVPVEPVHQLQEFRLGAGRPKHLDQPEAQSTAAMNGNARGLVHHQHVIILEHHGGFHHPCTRSPGFGCSAFACCTTGGIRTTSPACRRVSGFTRPLFTRTSPLRTMRYTILFGTPRKRAIRKLSTLWPAMSSSTLTS